MAHLCLYNIKFIEKKKHFICTIYINGSDVTKSAFRVKNSVCLNTSNRRWPECLLLLVLFVSDCHRQLVDCQAELLALLLVDVSAIKRCDHRLRCCQFHHVTNPTTTKLSLSVPATPPFSKKLSRLKIIRADSSWSDRPLRWRRERSISSFCSPRPIGGESFAR